MYFPTYSCIPSVVLNYGEKERQNTRGPQVLLESFDAKTENVQSGGISSNCVI